MSIVRGFVKSDSNGIIGTFDLEGVPYHLTIDTKPLADQFECNNATLKYGSFEKLIEGGSWSGTVGKTDLRIGCSKDITISGTFSTSRTSSAMVRGTGIWRTGWVTSPGYRRTGSTTSLDEPGAAGGRRATRRASIRSLPPTPVEFDMDDDPFKLARERNLLESGDPIIAILGQSGTGKSTFINLIASEQQKVGKGLQSCTSEISVLEAMVGGRRVVVIDTPGIDDTRVGMKEADILIAIARRLHAMGEHRIWVTGVLFMHRITDNKFSQTAGRISSILESLCGSVAMRRLMLCATMWDKVTEDEGYERFIELCETFGVWKEMVDIGANTSQISCVGSDAKTEAENIVSELIKNAGPAELAIQDEMVNQGKSVAETGAGVILAEHLKEVRDEERAVADARLAQVMLAHKREVETLKKDMANQARHHAERLQQQQERAGHEMTELREKVRKDTETKAKTTKKWGMKRDRERDVEPVGLAVNQSRAMPDSGVGMMISEYLRVAERDMQDMCDNLRQETAVAEARLMEAILAHGRDLERLKKLADEQMLAQQAKGARLQRERDELERQLEELRETVRKEREANAAKEHEATQA